MTYNSAMSNRGSPKQKSRRVMAATELAVVSPRTSAASQRLSGFFAIEISSTGHPVPVLLSGGLASVKAARVLPLPRA